MKFKDYLTGVEPVVEQIGVEGDSMNDIAIEYLDSIFDKIGEEAQYSQEGDILRYIVKRLQE